jgi:flavodoxin
MATKPLIIYYSKTGTTAKIVEILQQTIKAETRRLGEPGNLMDKLKHLTQNNAREYSINIDEFDSIILLTPIWKGNPTPAMTEYLEKTSLKNKKVIIGLVGANKENPHALEKLRRKAIEKGCIFIETLYLRGVPPGRDWSDLKEEDYHRESGKLVERIIIVKEYTR